MPPILISPIASSPHDGRDIPFLELLAAIRNVYKLSTPLALLLAIVGFLTCGHLTGSGLSTRLHLDLHDLARHGRIEHDGSLGHADTHTGSKYAPTTPDPALVKQLLDASAKVSSAESGTLTLEDLSHARAERDKQISKPLDAIHAEIARGEVALTFRTFADAHGKVSKAWLAQWYGEDRLPDDWVAPQEEIGLVNTMKISSAVKEEVEKIEKDA